MPIAAFGFDLLLDVLDLGPDLREAIPRLLWSLLWMSPLAGLRLGMVVPRATGVSENDD